MAIHRLMEFPLSHISNQIFEEEKKETIKVVQIENSRLKALQNANDLFCFPSFFAGNGCSGLIVFSSLCSHIFLQYEFEP